MCYPVDTVPYTPAKYLAEGEEGPGVPDQAGGSWLSWPSGRGRRVAFRAVVADSAFGDQDGLRAGLAEAGLPFVMACGRIRDLGARRRRAHPEGCGLGPEPGGPDDPGD